ncbi:UDP kinase [Ruminococcus albus SY3]|uniref:UDP kinase n=1 Tax=Ruminococcus albus SY3 TaxID=1341156 RepID=A0A011VTF6_RUMAL|nr:diacylglycerol kinase family protein [Ruminococcus albus]EXM37908.1 UDP kinase [Ruminococcus albus SY3]
MNIKTELLKFLKGFRYAASGIIRCIRTQRNMRFHIGAAGAVAIVAVLCSVSIAEKLALILTVGGVMALECVNTAIENAVDLATKSRPSQLAKAAKDCAAGAVLIFCIAAVFVAAEVFGRRILYILGCFAEYPELIIAAVLYFALWFWWVFLCFRENDDD